MPPAPLSPVCGSKTPILTTLSPEEAAESLEASAEASEEAEASDELSAGAAVSALALLSPQPARTQASIAMQSKSARIFFMFISSLSVHAIKTSVRGKLMSDIIASVEEKSKHFLRSLKDFVNLAEIVSESGRKNVFAALNGKSRSGLLFAAERFCTAQSAVNVGADDSVRPSPPQRKMKKPLLLHETEEAA